MYVGHIPCISACAWDNFDVNTETLDGKSTLHCTVGICYQNAVPKEELSHPSMTSRVQTVTGRMRRCFDVREGSIAPLSVSLKQAQFRLIPSSKVTELIYLRQSYLDFMWLLQSFSQKQPLFTGFISQYVTDALPQTVITYMDPIAKPPTSNDVVQETMVRSLKVARDTNQEYGFVTYDLAVAQKAYSIQALQAPVFDKLVILMGNFHLELAFYGAIGTFLADSGIEYLLTESGILGEGSVSGFIKGKFYNRCSRIHQILAAVMERALFKRYLDFLTDEEETLVQEICSYSSTTAEYCQTVTETTLLKNILDRYENFLHDNIEGKYGSTAAYWACYVYLINRVHRTLQRAVRTNDVDLYIRVLVCVNEVFFALNRPNYARWSSLFLCKLRELDPTARAILDGGALSVRRTKKSYARCAVDLALEQTVNRDAASPMKGITFFRNSESAFRRWSVSLAQRGMAMSELRQMAGLQMGEEPMMQLRRWRIKRDNEDMDGLAKTVDNTCNPFASSAPTSLVNLATGKITKEETEKFLLDTLSRGRRLREKFEEECATDSSRFLKPVARIKMLNFAAENIHVNEAKSTLRKMKAAEGVRDVFGRILALEDMNNDKLNLKNILSYPITSVPLSLAHSDGTPLKTDKATLTKALESKQQTVLAHNSLPQIKATIIDGGNILHETLGKHNKSTYATMARDLLVKICSSYGEEIHLVLDKYKSPSIKDSERTMRGSCMHQTFVITGSEQTQRQNGTELLKSCSFKEEFARFIMQEWKKPQYGSIIGRKRVYISHGGMCIQLKNNELGLLQILQPSHFQGCHEEADTLIAFHAKNISTGHILVRSTDTDVLIILLSIVQRTKSISIIMDYGAGNNRRYINVSEIADVLERENSGFTEALLGYHALTGCDFNPCFFRKGKVKPFKSIVADEEYVTALRSLTSLDVDIPGVTRYITFLYGEKSSNINEARFKAFMRMSYGNNKEPLTKLKKINCASLPPCQKVLYNQIKRAQFVARYWKRADQTDPSGTENPTDYGWRENQNGMLEPDWYAGSSLPSLITDTQTNDDDDDNKVLSKDAEESDKAWSEDSDSDTSEVLCHVTEDQWE